MSFASSWLCLLLWNAVASASSVCPQPNSAGDKYRTYDGSCNNIHNPTWGQAGTAQARFKDADGDPMVDYEADSTNDDLPRGGIPSNLPSPREISNRLMAEELGNPNDLFSKKLSGEHFAVGQFITHDLIKTRNIRGIDCCDAASSSFNDPDVCFPFTIPNDDQHFTPGCRSFIRAVKFPGATGTREQINDVTSYIDANALYGSSDSEVSDLRDTTVSYLMKTAPGEILPERVGGNCVKINPAEDFCQLTGDSRNDQTPTLGLNHLWPVREHNRIASELAVLNPQWDNDRIFEETRRIVIAEMQHVIYNEYLPAILDPKTMIEYNLYPKKAGKNPFHDGYNKTIDASVRNGFGVAAFRMGHSQAMKEVSLLDDDYTTKSTELLKDNFNAPHLIQRGQGMNVDEMTRWLTFNPASKIDILGVDAMRNMLFMRDVDLFSINIQRGRDHGSPSYNDWREFCGLKRKRFKNFKMVSKETQMILQDLYASADDIDLYVGGLLEKSKNGRVGQTFACLIAKQFFVTKFGDRYWYERPDPNFGFTKDQLNSIKQVSMAKLLCQNLGVDKMQEQAFFFPKNKGKLKNCSDLAGIDLSLWQESA